MASLSQADRQLCLNVIQAVYELKESVDALTRSTELLYAAMDAETPCRTCGHPMNLHVMRGDYEGECRSSTGCSCAQYVRVTA